MHRANSETNSATTFLVSRPRSISRGLLGALAGWFFGTRGGRGRGNPEPQLQLISPKVTFIYRGKRRAAAAIGKVLGRRLLPQMSPPRCRMRPIYSHSWSVAGELLLEASNQHCLTNNLFPGEKPQKPSDGERRGKRFSSGRKSNFPL